MSKYISELCGKATAYEYRTETDTLFQLPQGAFEFNGYLDKSIRFIEQIQLLDIDLWKLFVNQFRSNVDDQDRGWRCEYWGKMMRGACFTYEYTQNAALYDILEDTVRDLLTTQDKLGRFCTYSLDMEFTGWDMWGRKYIMLGLQYFCDICKDNNLKSEVINAMTAHADYIIDKIGEKNEGKILITEATNDWQGLNSSSILEPFVRLYSITKDKKYLDFSTYIINQGGISGGNIFELAYEGKLYPFEYPVTKAYEMMSCFEGLLEYYRITKIKKYKIAAQNFVRLIIESDITIIGCSGCTHELFDNSLLRQANTKYEGIVQETCVTVTWMKLCYQVLCLNGDSKLADYIELSIYNALLGSINSENIKNNGGLPFDSYSPLLPQIRGRQIGGLKKMENDTFYGCCAAIGSAGTGLTALSSVMAARKGLTVNLYINGTISAKTPSGSDLKLIISTDYPVSGLINIEVEIEKYEEFTLNLRIPEWSCENTIELNDIKLNNVTKGEYFSINKIWKKSDKITINLDMRARLLHALKYKEDPEAEYHIALKRGPIILARDARFGENVSETVDIKTDSDGYVNLIKSDDFKYNKVMEFIVPEYSGKSFHVIDYSSAGKTMNENSKMAAWLPISKNNI